MWNNIGIYSFAFTLLKWCREYGIPPQFCFTAFYSSQNCTKILCSLITIQKKKPICLQRTKERDRESESRIQCHITWHSI